MNIDDIPVIAMMQRGMSWMTRNHEVLARNIANADTPHFKALELEPVDFAAMLGRASRAGTLTQTAAGHMSGGRGAGDDGARIREIPNPYEMSETGNSVSLEEQAVKIALNAMNYQLAVTLYTKSVSMLRAAIGQRR